MENKFEILDIIDKYIDLENYVVPPINSSNKLELFEKFHQMNEDLKEKGLIGEHQNIYFSFNSNGNIENIHLQLETRCLPYEIPEEKFEINGADVIVRRRDLEDIEAAAETERKARFDFNSDEWKNYKRTKLIDDMLK